MAYNTNTERLLDKIRTSNKSADTNTETTATNTGTTATNTGNTRDNSRLSLGNDGVVVIAGTSPQSVTTGTYFAVQFIKATTPTVFTATSSTLVVDQEYPAGTIIYGDILTITGDANGMYALYKGNPA